MPKQKLLTASAVSLLAANIASATVQYNGSGQSFSYDGWNVDGAGSADATFVVNAGVIACISQTDGFNLAINGLGSVSGLAPSQNIGATLAFSSNANIYIAFASEMKVAGASAGSPFYMGFQFTNESSQTCYGWAKATVGSDYGSFTISEWAYEDSGASIRVGEKESVPEPAEAAAGLGALALGAAGLRRWRRRKSA